jgi:hypothetical protein
VVTLLLDVSLPKFCAFVARGGALSSNTLTGCEHAPHTPRAEHGQGLALRRHRRHRSVAGRTGRVWPEWPACAARRVRDLRRHGAACQHSPA